jgi:membrane peptidoglycan carboxypeptidase
MFEGLPAYIRPINSSEASTIYAQRDGRPVELATFYHENRVEVPFEEISPNIINAVLATEDPRFYEHAGVDMISLVRATLTNLATFGEGPGASTITMQYVKNSLVEAANQSGDEEAIRAATEVTVERKLREIRLAIALEKEVSKKQILAGYLNLAFFGNQINGVETASQYYFGTSAKNLNVPQAAYLAGMLKSPNDYKPDESDNFDRGIGRRNYVIQNMADQGFITQQQADTYKASPIQTRISDTKAGCEADQTTAYFCDYVVWTIRNSPEFGVDREDREELLRRGGLEIYTTLDMDLQQTAHEAVNEYLPGDNEWEFGTASVSVEAGTGRIITMAQNRVFDQSDNPGTGRTAVNFNTDREYGGSSGFQPGSTYKIFVLADWLKSGYTLGDHVDGREKEWDVANEFVARCGGLVGTWEPGNSGETVEDLSVLQATRTSQNTAFADMASQLDLCDIRDTAIDFGVHRADGNELSFVPSSILGVNEIAPLTMASAFAAIANEGTYCSPVAIDSVTKRRTGEQLNVPKSRCSQSVTPDIAAALAYAMQQVVSGGTAVASNTGQGIPLAGKTGTTDESIHTWMVGYSSEVATAVWVGNVKGLIPQRGKRVDGRAVSTLRHDIWRTIMTDVNEVYGGEAFPSASPRFLEPLTIPVPDVSGLDPLMAAEQIELLDLNAKIVEEPVSSARPEGAVAETFPFANESVPRGTLIEIFVSGGGLIEVPLVAGADLVQAQSTLENLGFAVSLPQPSQGFLYNKCDPELPPGVAWGTDPEVGSLVQANSAIVLIPNC